MSVGSPQACSGSILMNPLPSVGSSGGRPRRGSVAVCVSHTAEPPAWYRDAETNSSLYGQSPPKAEIKSRSNSVDRWAAADDLNSSEDDEASVATGQSSSGTSSNGQSISFAPLPKGKPRSNSITIGVASRAQMLATNVSHTAGPQSRQARYAGPQWYSPGGVVPPDVYTYKDIARGINSIWRKAKGRRASESSVTSSTSAEHALEMERDAKSKGGIEHIEEAVEEEDEDRFSSDEEEDEHEVRGRAVGLSMPGRNGSLESSSSEDGGSVESGGALSTSATSQGTVEEREQWEAEARRRAKGKGKV